MITSEEYQRLFDQEKAESARLNRLVNGRTFKEGEELKLKKTILNWYVKNPDVFEVPGVRGNPSRVEDKDKYDRDIEIALMMAMFGDDMKFVFTGYGSKCARIERYLDGKYLGFIFVSFKDII